MEFRYRVKNMEPFKDGNVLGGRFLRPNEILVVTQQEKDRIENSGGVLELLDTLVPNPLKHIEEVTPVVEEVPAEAPAEVAPEQKRRGRPKKNA